MSSKRFAWFLSIALTLAGTGVLWWAHQQWLTLTTVSFESGQAPSARLLLWLLTMIAAGFLFGMAASSARSSWERARPAVLLAVSFLPFAVLYYFWTQVTLGWFPTLPGRVADFIYNGSTLPAASLILGFFLSGLVGRVERADAPVMEAADDSFDEDGVDDSEE